MDTKNAFFFKQVLVYSEAAMDNAVSILHALSAMIYYLHFICYALSAMLYLLRFICYALSAMLYLLYVIRGFKGFIFFTTDSGTE